MTQFKLVRALLLIVLVAPEASAQYFARNCVQLPSVGWMSMDSSFSGLNELKWGLRDQIQIGTGYARDVWDLRLWWINETALGFAGVDLPGVPSSRIAVTLHGSTGLKYNFSTERWRPFVGLMVEILQIWNGQSDTLYPYVMSAPTWAALRPLAGIEYIFASDMSLEGQVGYVGMLNFEDPYRQALMARFAYKLYF